MISEKDAAVLKVLEAWRAIPEDKRGAFNDAAGGELVDALRGLNTIVESEGSQGGSDTTGGNATTEAKAGDVCDLGEGQQGVLVERDGQLVCEPKPAE